MVVKAIQDKWKPALDKCHDWSDGTSSWAAGKHVLKMHQHIQTHIHKQCNTPPQQLDSCPKQFQCNLKQMQSAAKQMEGLPEQHEMCLTLAGQDKTGEAMPQQIRTVQQMCHATHDGRVQGNCSISKY